MKKALLAIAALMVATSASAGENTFSLTASYDGNLYILDSNMSGNDCIAAIAATGNLIDLDGRLMVLTSNAQVACELEKSAAIARAN